MALFSRDKTKPVIFNKDKIIEDILEMIKKDYPEWRIIKVDEPNIDILLTKKVAIKEKIEINTQFSNHSRVKDASYSVIISFLIMKGDTQLNMDVINEISSWSTKYILTDSVMKVSSILKGFK